MTTDYAEKDPAATKKKKKTGRIDDKEVFVEHGLWPLVYQMLKKINSQLVRHLVREGRE